MYSSYTHKNCCQHLNCIKEIREGVDFTSLKNANFSQISEVSGQSIL